MTTQQAVEAGHLIASPLDTKPYADHDAKESRLVVTHSLRGEGADASEDGTGRGTPIIPVAFDTTQITSPISRANPQPGDPCHTLAKGQHPPAIAYRTSGNCGVMEQGDKTAALNCGSDPNQNIVAYQCHGSNVGPMGTIRAGNGNETGGVPFVAYALTNHGDGGQTDRRPQCVDSQMRVRRLTPRECERLQGFPDDWTRFGHDGKEISDSARYRMIGNSVAVPCIEWIARRIVAAS